MNFKHLINTFFLVTSLLLTNNIYGQTKPLLSSNSVKARSFFENAFRYYNNGDYEKTVKELDKALKEDSLFSEALLLKADAYDLNHKYPEEIVTYLKIIKYNLSNNPKVFINLGEAEYKIGRYTQAKVHLQKAMILSGLTNKDRNQLKWYIKNVDFAIKAVANPVSFKPQSISNNVNTNFNEYWPSLTADEKTLLYTIELPAKETDVFGNIKGQEDLYISNKEANGEWSKPYPISPNINTNKNEGSQALSVDNRLLFFTSCNRTDVIGHCDLYFTERDSSGWQVPVNAGRPINSNAWDSQPCIASDGMTLYFVSNRPGGKGGMDIWMSTLTESGTWGEPVNLGDSINTRGDEMSPFMHPDNSTLYFSSDGQIGMGGQDIFMAKRTGHNTWTSPKNLGYPINTFNEEYGMIVNTTGNLALFSSDRLSKKGRDIFTFSLDKNFRPVVVNYVNGVIVDSDTKEEIKADFELSDLETSEVVAKSTSVKGTGEYLMCLPINRGYGLNVSKKGYLMHSENFSIKKDGDTIQPYKINIDLQSIKVGRKEILRNIFFDVDSYELTKLSKVELNNLIKFLNINPETVIEIGGHTDITGAEFHNDTLSENRAKVVYDYLISNGISKDRLSYKGYGSNLPVSTNDSQSGRSLNRRTEFTIIDIRKQ